MSISDGNSKLGNIPNISTVPIQDCVNCGYCKDKCYAKKFYTMYPGVRMSWDNNSLLAKTRSYDYFQNVIDYVNKKKPKYFRWHVGGDILSQAYLQNMKLVAAICKDTIFACFTKRFDLDYSYMPGNLKIYFSLWPGMELPTVPDGVRIAWVQDGNESRIPKRVRTCPGKCNKCKTCWTGKTDIVFHLHR